MGGKRLVVNADDLGRTAGVNRGVEEAHRRGIVTSATVLVAHPAAAGLAALAARCPGLGLGLHLALTGGPAVLPASRIPGLVGATGRLPRSPEALLEADPGQLRAEARAQLERFRRLLGRDPTHLDSHHHAHRLPVVLDAVVEMARDLGVPVRSASPAVAERLRGEGLRSTDRFVEGFFGDSATVDTLLGILRGLREGTTELMCHPGAVDDELRLGSGYAEPRAGELRALADPRVRRAVDELGVRLIGYGEV